MGCRSEVTTTLNLASCSNLSGWHFMISYTQRSDRASMLARELRTSLRRLGFTVWFDVDMKDKSEAAMQEAVENSMVVLAVITGDGPNDDNAYFNRPFCVSELRWRFKAGKHLQPIVHLDDKKRIGTFIGMAPDDLKRVGSIDFIDLNPTDNDYWRVGLKKIFEKAVDALSRTDP